MPTPIAPGQLAKRLGITAPTLRAWAVRGVIPSHPMPFGRRRYILEDVLAALHALGFKEPQQ